MEPFFLDIGCRLSGPILSNALCNIQGNSNWPMWKPPVSNKDISKMRVIHGKKKIKISLRAPCLLILHNETWGRTPWTSFMHYLAFIRTLFGEPCSTWRSMRGNGAKLVNQKERCRGWHKLRATCFPFPCQCLIRLRNKRKPFKWVVHSKDKQWRSKRSTTLIDGLTNSSHLSFLAQSRCVFVLSDG